MCLVLSLLIPLNQMNQSLDWNPGILSIHPLISRGWELSWGHHLWSSQGCFCGTVLLHPDHVLVRGFVHICPPCPCAALSSGTKCGQELPGAPAKPMAECLGSRMLGVFGMRTSMALVEAAPQCPDCPCPHRLWRAVLPLPSLLKRSCEKREAGIPERPLLNMLVFCSTSV